jgi:hypothetical protein
MPINLDAVGATSTPLERSWSSTDCLLYALGVGAGSLDAVDFELEYTTENSTDRPQRVLPTFAAVVGGGGPPRSILGSIDLAMLVHGEQSIELSAPIPVEGSVRTTSVVTGIFDKGSGALVVSESTSVDAHSGEPRFTATSSLFIRGEGGFGGDRGPSGRDGSLPGREPDDLCRARRPGLAVPTVGRPQSVAFRSGLRQAGRLRPAHPARPVHVRVHGPGLAPQRLWLRRSAFSLHGGTLLAPDLPGRHAYDLDLGRRRGRPVPYRQPAR